MTNIHHKIQTNLIGWVFLPLLAVYVAERTMGIKPLKFLACALLFYVARALYHFYAAFTRPDTAEESSEIDKEVARMEGRCLRINNNFEVTVPEDFIVYTDTEDSYTLKHVPSGLERDVYLELRDKNRAVEALNQAINWLRSNG